ncbi:hypothetical protein E9993_05505 [Labilibacter sediminis]|nr:hypothetical protein E9993_05505 [Labilibacter sediminis]
MIEKIKKGFIDDSIKELESIEIDLGNERLGSVSDCVIEKIFTTTHNIKGTAPMLGIVGVQEIVEPIEQVYAALRKGDLTCSSEIVDNTIKLIPVIKSELNISQPHDIDSEDLNKSLKFFDSLISKDAGA